MLTFREYNCKAQKCMYRLCFFFFVICYCCCFKLDCIRYFCLRLDSSYSVLLSNMQMKEGEGISGETSSTEPPATLTTKGNIHFAH